MVEGESRFSDEQLLNTLFGERVEGSDLGSEPIQETDLRTIIKEVTDDVLGCLEPLEVEVMRKRYLYGLTQVETGRAFNPPLSRWQIGRIEGMAKRRLREVRGPKRRLRDYLE